MTRPPGWHRIGDEWFSDDENWKATRTRDDEYPWTLRYRAVDGNWKTVDNGYLTAVDAMAEADGIRETGRWPASCQVSTRKEEPVSIRDGDVLNVAELTAEARGYARGYRAAHQLNAVAATTESADGAVLFGAAYGHAVREYNATRTTYLPSIQAAFAHWQFSDGTGITPVAVRGKDGE